MLRNWANTVTSADTILHLGDVVFSNVDYWIEELSHMPGRKLLIKGNHDHSRTVKKLKKVFEIIDPFVQEFDRDKIFFSHYPDQKFEVDWDLNIHGHIHNNDYTKLREHGRTYYNASIEVMGYRPVTLRSILLELGWVY